MKLGICYMVFDGEELLEFAVKAIRNHIDYISATYQSISYWGNPADPDLLETLTRLHSLGLIDELIHFDTDLSRTPKENELDLRNVGLEASRRMGCTHHISADVDEFYLPEQLEYAKKVIEEGDYDFSAAPMFTYYKDPTFLVSPVQKLLVSFIHPVYNSYEKNVEYPHFPLHMETTRRFEHYSKYKLFTTDEMVIHHMSYVRRDIRKKFANNDNMRFYKLEKFYKTFDDYKLGGRVCLLPEYLNRTTVKVENTFGIHI